MDFTLKWGFMSAGRICHDLATVLACLPEKHHRVVAVGARDLPRAQEFAHKHGIPNAFGSYEELVQCADVNIIYVATISPEHKRSVLLALNAGKAVLCEKSMGCTAAEVKEMVQLARQKGLFLMEGFWSRFFPVYRQMQADIERGLIGQPLLLNANFGITRLRAGLDAGKFDGTMSAIGCYLMQLVNWLWPGEDPIDIHVSVVNHKNGGDDTATIRLDFSGGRCAQVCYTAMADFANDALIVGTKGSLQIPDNFWAPTRLITSEKVYNVELPPVKDRLNFPQSEGLCYEAEAVRMFLAQGLLESPEMRLDESIRIANWIDIIRQKFKS